MSCARETVRGTESVVCQKIGCLAAEVVCHRDSLLLDCSLWMSVFLLSQHTAASASLEDQAIMVSDPVFGHICCSNQCQPLACFPVVVGKFAICSHAVCMLQCDGAQEAW